MDIDTLAKIISYLLLIFVFALICMAISTIIICNPTPVYTSC